MTSPAADTPGIVAFIEARLDEREKLARICVAGPMSPIEDRLARHLLAEVAKDRAILALHRPEGDDFGGRDRCIECNYPYPCRTVRLLAAIDADHQAYDPSWKPVAT